MSEKEMRELDAWIAEHVMGWAWYCAVGTAFLIPPFAHERFDSFSVHWTKGVHEKGWTRNEPEKKSCKKLFNIEHHYSNYDYCSLPHYTTDRAASMEVLVKLVDNDDVTIRAIANQFLVSTADDPDKAPNRNIVKAGTLPLAIALFAKKIYEKD